MEGPADEITERAISTRAMEAVATIMPVAAASAVVAMLAAATVATVAMPAATLAAVATVVAMGTVVAVPSVVGVLLAIAVTVAMPTSAAIVIATATLLAMAPTAAVTDDPTHDTDGHGCMRSVVGLVTKEFVCPISLELPSDAVTAEDGWIYERASISAHIAMQGDYVRSPMTNEHMGSKLIPAWQVRSAIELLRRNGGFQLDKRPHDQWLGCCDPFTSLYGWKALLHDLASFCVNGVNAMQSNDTRSVSRGSFLGRLTPYRLGSVSVVTHTSNSRVWQCLSRSWMRHDQGAKGVCR